jgi:hypothetical protein
MGMGPSGEIPAGGENPSKINGLTGFLAYVIGLIKLL